MGTILSVGAKALTMVTALVCGVLTTRMVLGQAGVEHYALYTLLAALPGLVSFTDLGSGAVIVGGVATSPDVRHDARLTAQVTTVGRVMLLSAATLLTANTVLYLSGGWAAVLGEAGDVPGAPLAAFVCLSVFCLGVPLGIWQRVMLGLRKNHVIILLQGMQSPLTLLTVWTLLRLDEASVRPYLAIGSFGAAFTVGVLGLALASRLTFPLLATAARRVPYPRRHPGTTVMDVGWPMLAQLIATPLSMTLQRYVLAQSGTATDMSEYGVVGQVFFALQGLVGAAGLTLWPAFTRARHTGDLRRGPFAISALFAVAIAAVSAAVWLGREWIFEVITDGQLEVAGQSVLAFGAMVTVQAALYPLGMFIMDKPGIRFQVVPTLLMAASTVALAFALTPSLGVVGPLLSNVVSVLVFQVVPFSLYIRRNRERLWSDPLRPRETVTDATGPA